MKTQQNKIKQDKPRKWPRETAAKRSGGQRKRWETMEVQNPK